MGVGDWPRFRKLMDLLTDAPEVVRRARDIQGLFAARLADNILSSTQVDAAIFSEPISGNEGPLILPRMYEDIVLSSYRPLFSVLRSHGVDYEPEKTVEDRNVIFVIGILIISLGELLRVREAFFGRPRHPVCVSRISWLYDRHG